MKAWTLALQLQSGVVHRHKYNWLLQKFELNNTALLSITEGLSFAVPDFIKTIFWDTKKQQLMLLMVVKKIETFFEILVKIFFKFFEIILMVVEKIKNDEEKYLDEWRSHFRV